MNIEKLSFLTELTDEDASHVNGGGYYDYDPYTGEDAYVPIWGSLPNYLGVMELGANPITVEPTDTGV